MKLLAKSALKTDQIKARKDLEADGIEILLLDADMNEDSSGKTVDALSALASNWPVIGLELADQFGTVPIDPTSANENVRIHSQNFLFRAVDIANNVAARSGVTVYLQYQYLFDSPFDSNGKPNSFGWGPVLHKIHEFYAELKKRIGQGIDLQMENTVPVGCPVGGNLYHCFAATRPRDFKLMGIPIAFDIAHYAQALFTWANAKPSRQRIVKDEAKNVRDNSNVYVITPDDRKYIIGMTKTDVRYGNLVRKNSTKDSVKSAITKEIINVIYAHKSLIGSLQFSDSLPGFGTEECEAGYLGDKGMIDVPAVLRAVVDAKNPDTGECAIQYLIPEYHEQDYSNLLNQRKAFEMAREIMATAGTRRTGT